MTNDAENHKKIAEAVWPDKEPVIVNVSRMWNGRAIRGHEDKCMLSLRRFDLLETDSNGEPTQQACANGLKVLGWLNSYIVNGDGEVELNEDDVQPHIYELLCECPWLEPKSIYLAACEVLGLGVSDD